MEITQAGASGLGGVGLSEGFNATMGKEDFLKLLMAQLANQDPLNPMENTEFVAQLAQFSSLEQQMATNEGLSMLQMGQASMTNTQIAGLIGKEVEANGNVLQVTQQGPTGINYDLSAPAAEVTVTIRDTQGNIIRSLELGPRGSGLNTSTWDGKDINGNLVQPGTYQMEVSAKDIDGNAVDASTKFTGIVSGVSYEGGIPVLEIGSSTVRVGDVIAIRIPTGASQTAEQSTSIE